MSVFQCSCDLELNNHSAFDQKVGPEIPNDLPSEVNRYRGLFTASIPASRNASAIAFW